MSIGKGTGKGRWVGRCRAERTISQLEDLWLRQWKATQVPILFLTASFSGLRASELTALRWLNVDNSGEIEVRPRARPKSRIGLRKSAASRRKIQIPGHLLDLLHGWKLTCPARRDANDAQTETC
jgi:integrase